MKRSLGFILLALLITLCEVGHTKETGNLGAGVIIGNPTGPTVKYWLSEKTAWDVAIGFQEEISVHGDLLFQAWDVFPQPQVGKIGGYLVLGAKYQEKKKNDLFGIRVVGGLNYWTHKYPIEIFLELVPVFELSPKTDTDIDAGVGLRYYFKLN